MTNASRAPDWLNALGLEPMSLGLDLRGGMLLVYEVDTEGAVAQLLQRMERDFRKVLRDARIPYQEVAVAGQCHGRDAARRRGDRRCAQGAARIRPAADARRRTAAGRRCRRP